jgi:hypothetical protein
LRGLHSGPPVGVGGVDESYGRKLAGGRRVAGPEPQRQRVDVERIPRASVDTKISQAGADQSTGHEEPGAEGLGFLFVVGPAVDVAAAQRALEVDIDLEGVLENVVTELVAGGVPLAGAWVAGVQQDPRRRVFRQVET